MKQTETLIIPSDPDELPKVDEMAERIAAEAGFGKEIRDDIAIAVTEAVNNAIMHGNNADRKRTVTIVFIKEPGKLTVKIRDQGNGFDPSILPDPTHPENIMREKGRGLFIIRHLMDEVTLHKVEGGMEVELVKALEKMGGQ